MWRANNGLSGKDNRSRNGKSKRKKWEIASLRQSDITHEDKEGNSQSIGKGWEALNEALCKISESSMLLYHPIQMSRCFPWEWKQPSYGSFSCYPVKITPDFRIYNNRLWQVHEQNCVETFNKIKLYIQNYQLDLKSRIHKDYGLDALVHT